jgi:hypothetical protein
MEDSRNASWDNASTKKSGSKKSPTLKQSSFRRSSIKEKPQSKRRLSGLFSIDKRSASQTDFKPSSRRLSIEKLSKNRNERSQRKKEKNQEQIARQVMMDFYNHED